MSYGRWAQEPALLRSHHAWLDGLRVTDTRTKSLGAPALRRGEPAGTKVLHGVTNLLRTCCARLGKTLSSATCVATHPPPSHRMMWLGKGLGDASGWGRCLAGHMGMAANPTL